jgi:hypothetical protein
MELTSLIQPAVVAAVIASLFSVIGLLINRATVRSMHRERLNFDERQVERKITADIDLAERKFKFDSDLAERRFVYDRRFSDHKRRVELAEEVLAGFLRMRDILREVRSPLAFGNEGEDRPQSDNETDQQAKARRTYFVPISRLLKYSDFINGLMTKRYQMNAYFGPAAEVPFNTIWNVLAQIQSAARMMIGSLAADGQRQGSDNLWDKWERAIWEGLEDPDPHVAEIETAIAAVEAICRPTLTGASE